MHKNCKQCSIEFEITQEDFDFYDKVSPVFLGKKYEIPSPVMCPICRDQLRLTFRNERKLYSRKCDKCKKSIVSNFSSDSPVKLIYCEDCYWSDDFNGIDHGKDFDFNRGFFEQFLELLNTVPKINLAVTKNQNCPYLNFTWNSKDSYMCFDLGYGENCYYDNACHFVKNLVDCSYCKNSEILYECIESSNCYNSIFLEKCNNCNDSAFLFDCKSCKNCILCSGLINAEHCVNNKKVSKEEYESVYNEIKNDVKAIDKYKSKFTKLKARSIHRASYNKSVENCMGDNILNSKNCISCYDVYKSEDIKYCHSIDSDLKDCMDCSSAAEGELLYDIQCASGYSIILSNILVGKNALYCSYCFNDVEDCFGSTSLKKAKYCILNKQYTKEEYEMLVSKIIGDC